MIGLIAWNEGEKNQPDSQVYLDVYDAESYLKRKQPADYLPKLTSIPIEEYSQPVDVILPPGDYFVDVKTKVDHRLLTT